MWAAIRQNFGYKLVSVLCAVVLSLYVRIGQEPESAPLPDRVEVRQGSSDLEYRLSPDSVDLVVSGPMEVVRRTRAEDIDTYVDVQGLRPGRHRLPIRCQPVAFSQILRCRPDPPTVLVTVRARVSERLPIDVRWVGPDPLGYFYSVKSMSPVSAVVSGPDDLVRRVKHLVATVAKTGADIQDTVALVPVDLLGVRVAGVEVTPTHVQIAATRQPEPQSKEVFVTPNLVGRPPAGFRVVDIVVNPPTVRAMGTAEALSRISAVKTVPLDLSETTSSAERRLPLQPVGALKFDTDAVTVQVIVAPIAPSNTAPEGETTTSG